MNPGWGNVPNPANVMGGTLLAHQQAAGLVQPNMMPMQQGGMMMVILSLLF